MSILKLWAPSALSVELVKGDDKSSFIPPVNMVKATATYKSVSMSGYWDLPGDIGICQGIWRFLYRMAMVIGSK